MEDIALLRIPPACQASQNFRVSFVGLCRNPTAGRIVSRDAILCRPYGRCSIADEQIIYTADTFMALRHAAEEGSGITILPCFLGDASERLVRASDVLEPCRNGMWILTHKDLMQTARIKTFTEFMNAALKTETSRLLGTQ